MITALIYMLSRLLEALHMAIGSSQGSGELRTGIIIIGKTTCKTQKGPALDFPPLFMEQTALHDCSHAAGEVRRDWISGTVSRNKLQMFMVLRGSARSMLYVELPLRVLILKTRARSLYIV
ncbi:uncharacterized protein EDB91DRAFT_1151665, partial [Suillus paluster]|uniref:uncharacterized protein n=1 Tax=Suillus paluster TaxID=48578 RepID=UPI001B87DAF4